MQGVWPSTLGAWPGVRCVGERESIQRMRGDLTAADHNAFLLFDDQEDREKSHEFQCLFRGSRECIMSL